MSKSPLYRSTTSGKVQEAASTDTMGPIADPVVSTDIATKSYVDAQFTSGNMVAGVNNQTGTTYTVLNTDRAKLVSFSNTAAVAVTLPQAGSGGSFSNTWFAWFENRNSGMVTVTPTTSTIDGSTALVLANGCGIGIFSDGSNYFTMQGNVASLQSVATGSNSYTANQTQTFSLVMPKAVMMFQVTEAASKKFRLRLYSTSAARTADANRPYSVPILLGPQNKLILDLFIDQSSAVTPFFLSPAILGVNGDGTPATTIYASVTSFETSTQNINVTVSFIPLGN